LPGRVFVVNFIRSYAQVIGLEPDEAVLRYEESNGSDEVETAVEPPKRARAKLVPWIVTGILALGGLIAGSAVLLHRIH
jgi:cytoskeletal protein RodZ